MNVSKRRSMWPLVIVTAVLAAVAVLVLVGADPVMAASGTGQKVGADVSSWGKALILGVIGLVGIPVIAKLDFARASLWCCWRWWWAGSSSRPARPRM